MSSEMGVVELRSEREPPPYFAGRTKELAALQKRLRSLCKTGDPRGGIALIHGVPGVGKTQLGLKFAEDATESSGDLDIRHLAIDTTLLESDVDLFMTMAQALDAEEAARKVADLDTRSTGRTAGVGFVRGGISQEHARHTGSLFALLAASKRARLWQGKALVLLVDELQAVRPEGIVALRVLHQGDHGCPVLLVGIGLQHTLQVLSNPADGLKGISRVATRIQLGCLSDADALAAIKESMRVLGHQIPTASATALAQASYGFPQHIHCYLQGALDAIAEHGSLEAGPALDAALQAGDHARIDYYDARLATLPDQDAVLPIIQAMLQAGRESLRRSEAVRAVNAASLDGEKTVHEAIAHGVLTLERGGVSFGIPSFHSYMKRLLEEHGPHT